MKKIRSVFDRDIKYERVLNSDYSTFKFYCTRITHISDLYFFSKKWIDKTFNKRYFCNIVVIGRNNRPESYKISDALDVDLTVNKSLVFFIYILYDKAHQIDSNSEIVINSDSTQISENENL